MKKVFSIILFLFLAFSAYSVDFSLKYGKVTNDEVAMTVYEKDTTANAVVLYKKGDVYYEITDDFTVCYEFETKIKILTSDGTDYANMTIPLYHKKGQNSHKESISKLEAYAYNMENGKVVKTKMDKSYVFEERVSEYYKQVKFTVPVVKAGTVIEYKYKITSDFYYSLADWDAQQSIPVIFAQYTMKIPEYFRFSFDTKGYEKIECNEVSDNQTFVIRIPNGQSEMVHATARKLTFTLKDIPALKADEYIWCLSDFMSRVSFELHGVQFPYSIYKPYSRSWNDIDRLLRESDSFGEYVTMRNPFKDEMKDLPLQDMSDGEKIRSLFYLLKTKIAWNERYGFSGYNVRQAIKEGTGTNAEFNFVLLSMLKDAGIKAYPILLSRRSMGRLPYTHPSIDKINTFIVGAEDTDSTMVYMDGSIVYGDVNILPPVLMVDRARLFDMKNNGQWLDLTNVGRTLYRSAINITIDPAESIIKGSKQSSYTGAAARMHKMDFLQAKDSLSFIESLQADHEFVVDDYKHSNVEGFSQQTREIVQFTKSITATEDHIYLNPMIFPQAVKNSFIEEERKLPVEFAYPYEIRITTVIDIPEGYEVEEMPQAIRFSTEGGDFSCLYNIKEVDNKILLNYNFSCKKIIFSQLEYPSLKAFWETLVTKNTQQLVFKKKEVSL